MPQAMRLVTKEASNEAAIRISFFGLVSGPGLTAALAQMDDSGQCIPAPVVSGSFQTLGNLIHNPDAPRRPRSHRKSGRPLSPTGGGITPSCSPP
jgi:hypothetical protein